MDRETETVINRLMSDLKAAQDLSDYLTARNKKLREALRVVGYGPPHEGEPLELLNQFVDIARSALKDGE